MRWTQLPEQLHALVADTPDSVLLETSRFDAGNRRSFVFLDAVETIAVTRLDEIPELFRRIEEALRAGLYVAGFLGYECGYHFEHIDGISNASFEGHALPLAWFGVYREPMVFDHERGCFEGEFGFSLTEAPAGERHVLFGDAETLEIGQEDYCAKIQRIKEYIRAGETYQVNFTDKVKVQMKALAGAAFAALVGRQPVPYSALLHVEGHHILSLSPELFFRIEDGRIVTRPMKGTMRRGLDREEDAGAAVRLGEDEKNRAEHVMIVDLLRNDLGRICEMGSVRVEDIFSVERYRTLLQMTSTVSGRLRAGLSYYDIFKAMFPSGSITGAPKIRTMEIIRELERGPRGVYTGAIGFMSPEGAATFNVAIRTLVLKEGEARMGVGGGIVADSEPMEEYQECLLKAEFLTRPRLEFQLIETMLWEGEFFLLEMHLERLEASAEYFDFAFDRAGVIARLEEEARGFRAEGRYRVRLLLDEVGAVMVSAVALGEEHTAANVRLSTERTFSGDVFLRHKTTRRELYEREYDRARAEGLADVIFMNERGEITEGTINNVFVRRDGKLLTPPLGSGVLPGVFRRHLLETDASVEERVLTLADFETAEAIYLGNSVRGLREVRLAEAETV